MKGTKKVVPLEWKDEYQLSFQTLVEELTTPPEDAYADCRLPFSVYTNNPLNDLGAVLYQEPDNKERDAALKSKKDSKHQESIQSSTTPVPGYQIGK